MSEIQNNSREQEMEKYFFRASVGDFKKIPGSPIAYWTAESALESFERLLPISEAFMPRQGLATTDNNRFVRNWQEVSFKDIGFKMLSRDMASESNLKWFPMDKGGGYRKWYGNNIAIVNWQRDGAEIKENIIIKYPYLNGNPDFVAKNSSYYFKRGTTWGKITSSKFSCRYTGVGFIFSDAGSKIPTENEIDALTVTQFLNSSVSSYCLSLLSQTLNFEQGTIAKLPFDKTLNELNTAKQLIELSVYDWDSQEDSWDFTIHPLLDSNYHQLTLQSSYISLRAHWLEMTQEMQRLEAENNRIFIDAYGLQDELTPEVPLKEITLTCNPHYRYGGDKSEEELETLLLADTTRELVSYAVGCMLGRYSLDKPGLVLANQGETLADYLTQVPQPRFMPDDDNVIPLLDGDWFADDITLRFRQFLRVAFGDAHYEDNLAFIEQALNIKGKRNYSLRDYFLGEFYTDHVKRYKKRPIYWLFSSHKGSFNALVYMHRYRPDTVSVVLKYLRDYREKLSTERERQLAVSINPASSQGEKTKANKEAERLAKVLAELADYERDTLYPLATEQVQIDLDDGVKVNYLKLGDALKKIVGLAAKDED